MIIEAIERHLNIWSFASRCGRSQPYPTKAPDAERRERQVLSAVVAGLPNK